MSSTSARLRLTRIMNTPRFRQTPKADRNRKWNILRGDKVQVVGSHPEKGKQGTVLQVLRATDQVLVEGVNMAKRRIKGDADRGIKGRTVEEEQAIPYCKVNLIDPLSGKPTRVIRKFLDDGTKVRIAKKSGTVIPRPEILKFRKRAVNSLATESDTTEDDAWEVTYVPPDHSSK